MEYHQRQTLRQSLLLISFRLLLQFSHQLDHHRYNIVKSLAFALLYLHEEWDEQVIHRNITSSVVTLELDMTPKLGAVDLRLWCPRLGSFGVVMLEIVSGLKTVDFRQPEVLLVKKVHEFEVRKRPLEALADMGLNGEYNLKELMTLTSMKHGASQAALSRLGVKQHKHSVDEKSVDLDLLETESLAGFMLILESAYLEWQPEATQSGTEKEESRAVIADNNVVAITSNLRQSVLRQKEKGETIGF
ncbi:hypothetical protein JHK85_048911 [Glycine max]|nr:hypothetical protein JHK85_048911 [Glycine max]